MERPAPGTIPDAPGVYRFLDATGRVIYVGKALSLRSRLAGYFQDPRALHQRTRAMVEAAAGVDWTVVSTEVEALQLEYNWIKEFDPRFNVRYRDDKSYPSLAVTLNEPYPRATVMRGPKKKGVRYFGPYAHAWAIRETLDLLLRAFPVRTCSDGVFKRAGQIGRPCLLGYIGKCSAPCVGRVTEAEHRQIAEDFCDFVAGQTSAYLKRLEKEMFAAADAQEYERAARLRDDVAALRRAIEKQAVVLPSGDADVVGIAEDELEAALHVFFVRAGRVRGQRGWVGERTEDVISTFLEQLYGENDDLPKEVLVPALPGAPIAEWRNLTIRVPERGAKKQLLDTVTRNAEQALQLHKLRRAGDLTARSRALAEVQDALGMLDAPLRIECFDISHTQSTAVTGSMVVFEDGLPRKNAYRRFSVTAGDDLSAIYEVVHRRFSRHQDERFAYPPGLLVVDGGAAQVAAAARAMDELGVVDVTLCGLAKRLEEVWLPDRDEPLILSRTSEGLYLLQRIRDEAHRFAVAYHRQKRSRSMTASALDGVPGLGEARRTALLKHFGSLKRLRAATVAEIAVVPGIGPKTAARILLHLTGEIA